MARRWGEARENQLRAGTLTLEKSTVDVPTWDEFFPRFVEHCIGEREKESSIREKGRATACGSLLRSDPGARRIPTST